MSASKNYSGDADACRDVDSFACRVEDLYGGNCVFVPDVGFNQ